MSVLAPERQAGDLAVGRPLIASPPPTRPAAASGRGGSRRSLRRAAAAAVTVVAASLLAVVGADAYLTQGQVRLTRMQSQLTTVSDTYRDLQLRVARLSTPARIVSQAEGDGLVAPTHVTDLPQVTLPSGATAASHTTPASTPSPSR